jgi:hypothetical protein
MTVAVPPQGRQAKPNRGPKLFRSVLYGAEGQPSTPAKRTTPGVPEIGLIASASKPFIRLSASTIGVSVSHRTPKLRVRLERTVQSSWAKAARYQLDRSRISVSRMVTLLGNPSSRLAMPWPVFAPPGNAVGCVVKAKLPEIDGRFTS